MQVILTKHLDNLGSKYELVNVKQGYARNYLFPKKIAMEASDTNLRKRAEALKVQEIKQVKMLAEINKVIADLKAAKLVIGAKTGTRGKIFGSITSLQLARVIHQVNGYEIDRRKIVIPDNIKELGVYKATIHFSNHHVTEVILK